MPTRPEPAARSSTRLPATMPRIVEHIARERLSARPGEGPVGRRQADGVELLLGLLPDRHRLVGDVERNLRHVRHRLEPRVGADEGFAVGDHAGIVLSENSLGHERREFSMPAIKPDRLLGDLYKLRTFGTYKTGVHRPTFSPDDIAARNWFAEQCTAAGLETTIDGIGNILGKSKRGRRARRCPARIWKARTMRAGSTVRSAASTRWKPRARSRKPAAIPASTSWCSATRRGTSARSSARSRSPALLTDEDIDKAKNRHDGTPMREALQDSRLCGTAARARSSRSATRLLRGAHRAGRHARKREAAHRRRHGDRGDLAVRHSR